MRRDLLVTALIFLAIGFAGGYLYFVQSRGRARPSPLLPPPGASSPEIEDSTLPAGHPPLDVAARWQQLKQAAESDPRDAGAALALANFLFDIERWNDAVFWYRRTVELEPKNGDARTDLATCYYNLGRFEEADREYSQSLTLEPNKPQALYGLAMVRLHDNRDVASARQLYERLRRNHPDFPGLEQLARLLAEEQRR